MSSVGDNTIHLHGVAAKIIAAVSYAFIAIIWLIVGCCFLAAFCNSRSRRSASVRAYRIAAAPTSAAPATDTAGAGASPTASRADPDHDALDSVDNDEEKGAGSSKDQLPTFVYSSTLGDGHEEKLSCTVCLSEFKDGERCRLIPSCGHSFHVECIDMWLSSHATCPLCRATVDS